MKPPFQTGAARIAIRRMGTQCSITEPVDSDDAVNGYGKKSEDSWSEVGTEPVVRVYQRGAAPSQNRMAGGRYRTESPLLIFFPDSLVEEGYRVEYDDTVYEVDTLNEYPTHLEGDTTVVN